MTARSMFQWQFLTGFSARRCSLWSNRGSLAVVACLLQALVTVSAQAADHDRVALILSAQDYASYGKSPISVDTVKQIGSALEQQGFHVDTVTNANNSVSRAKLRDFAKNSEGARVAIAVLAGHGVSSGGRAYFLPANAEIRRATDLLSRAVAVSSVAQIAARAESGAVFFFTTVADISSAVARISARPSMKAAPKDNVVVVFSTSDKVPVSRVSSVSRQAAVDFADAAVEKPLTMDILVGAAAAGDVGQIMGRLGEIDLSNAPKPVVVAKPVPPKPSQAEIEARRGAEKRAREAETRARQAEARAREAEARAKLEAERAREAEKTAALAAEPEPVESEPEPEPAKPAASNVDALQVVEALLGRSKKKQLQRRMKKLGFYKGPIDAIFGDLTRQGIRDYQADLGEEPTGYLTPSQIQSLVEG
ncbi:MAG: peptidoglycan-binding protein [Alphaproteobacteria bacterium]|nr:peptidoglycan-binding protein [Alphaproteobacteria bacterium]